MKAIIQWFKTLRHIVTHYHKDKQFVLEQIKHAENIIRQRTEINADVHFHGHNRNQIIVVGRYRNRDYVQVFTTDDTDFVSFINQLKEMEQYGVINRIDAPMMMNQVIERDLIL